MMRAEMKQEFIVDKQLYSEIRKRNSIIFAAGCFEKYEIYNYWNNCKEITILNRKLLGTVKRTNLKSFEIIEKAN